MKRVIAACFSQTLHFQLKEDIPHEEAVRQLKAEVEKYKWSLGKKRIQYKIDSEVEQPDGSVIITIRKQYLTTPVGQYLD